jgi:hypothetical protein
MIRITARYAQPLAQFKASRRRLRPERRERSKCPVLNDLGVHLVERRYGATLPEASHPFRK